MQFPRGVVGCRSTKLLSPAPPRDAERLRRMSEVVQALAREEQQDPINSMQGVMERHVEELLLTKDILRGEVGQSLSPQTRIDAELAVLAGLWSSESMAAARMQQRRVLELLEEGRRSGQLTDLQVWE